MFASLIPALGFTSLLYLILKLGLIGFIVYLITTYIPMNDIIKKVIYVIVAVAVILYCINFFNIS